MLNKINPSLGNLLPYLYYESINEENLIIVDYENIQFCMHLLRKHIGLRFNLLTCISGVDLLVEKYRFTIVYELLSLNFNLRIRVKLFMNDIVRLPSITSIFINANWWEREVWDLFGIFFKGHPDVRRILNDYSFEGYPIRKDFPLTGFVELYYNQHRRLVTYQEVQLTQSYRVF